MMSRITAVQVCDARDDAQGRERWPTKIIRTVNDETALIR
jgi:hypothetical protein